MLAVDAGGRITSDGRRKTVCRISRRKQVPFMGKLIYGYQHFTGDSEDTFTNLRMEFSS